MKTQAEIIKELRLMTGTDEYSLSEEVAVSSLNRSIDRYSHLANTNSGTWQAGDIARSGLPRATIQLLSGESSVRLREDFGSIEYLELSDATRVLGKIDPYDLRNAEKTTEKGSGAPRKYDLLSDVMVFDVEADQDYTLTCFFKRAFVHLVAGDTTQKLGTLPIHDEFILRRSIFDLGLNNTNENRVQTRKELIILENEIKDHYGRRDEDTDTKLEAVINAPA